MAGGSLTYICRHKRQRYEKFYSSMWQRKIMGNSSSVNKLMCKFLEDFSTHVRLFRTWKISWERSQALLPTLKNVHVVLHFSKEFSIKQYKNMHVVSKIGMFSNLNMFRDNIVHNWSICSTPRNCQPCLEPPVLHIWYFSSVITIIYDV
jgi:hypothetical protein